MRLGTKNNYENKSKRKDTKVGSSKNSSFSNNFDELNLLKTMNTDKSEDYKRNSKTYESDKNSRKSKGSSVIEKDRFNTQKSDNKTIIEENAEEYDFGSDEDAPKKLNDTGTTLKETVKNENKVSDKKISRNENLSVNSNPRSKRSRKISSKLLNSEKE